MSRDAAILLAMFLVGAGWLMQHLVLVTRIVRARRLSPWLRALSALPPLTPVLGFMSRLPLSSSLWLGLAVAYGVLWRFS